MHRTQNRSCPWPGGGTDNITEILNNNALPPFTTIQLPTTWLSRSCIYGCPVRTIFIITVINAIVVTKRESIKESLVFFLPIHTLLSAGRHIRFQFVDDDDDDEGVGAVVFRTRLSDHNYEEWSRTAQFKSPTTIDL